MRSMDDLLTIGRFARLAGLSVGALRHYDELDLLRPARTDPFTSYRLYARGQLETARLIVRLRDLEVPLETIRACSSPTDDPAERRRLMREHRARIEARTFRLQRVLHILGQLSSEAPACHDRHHPLPRPSSTRRRRRTARRRPVQPHLDPARAAGPHARAGRRDDPQRPRLALPLGRGRRPGPSISPAANGSAHGSTRSSAGRSRPLACAPVPGHQRGGRLGRLGHRLGVRGDGPGVPRGGRRAPRSPPGRPGRRRPWTGSPTGTIAS